MPDKLVEPMSIDAIKAMTARARALPPSGDQSHVLVEDGEDPWVMSHDNNFYYCTVDRQKQKILVSKFADLDHMATAPLVEIWPKDHRDIPKYLEIWGPELHYIDGRWYVHFALHDGRNGKERMYVLEGKTLDPQEGYVYKGTVVTDRERWSIDGSILEMPDKQKYFVWSGWEDLTNERQNIYIARMKNPWTFSSPRVCISRPEYDWEKNGYPYVNEGPQALVHEGKIFVIYSASGSWTDDYCLGQLTYTGGDPLDPAAWQKKPEPVFKKTDTIFGVGHCCFVKQDDQDWLVYHAARSSGAGWARQVRAKPFTWNEDGSPNFGQPE